MADETAGGEPGDESPACEPAQAAANEEETPAGDGEGGVAGECREEDSGVAAETAGEYAGGAPAPAEDTVGAAPGEDPADVQQSITEEGADKAEVPADAPVGEEQREEEGAREGEAERSAELAEGGGEAPGGEAEDAPPSAAGAPVHEVDPVEALEAELAQAIAARSAARTRAGAARRELNARVEALSVAREASRVVTAQRDAARQRVEEACDEVRKESVAAAARESSLAARLADMRRLVQQREEEGWFVQRLAHLGKADGQRAAPAPVSPPQAEQRPSIRRPSGSPHRSPPPPRPGPDAPGLRVRITGMAAEAAVLNGKEGRVEGSSAGRIVVRLPGDGVMLFSPSNLEPLVANR
eukprot:Hpha_TRINITY_DN8611_c0_g3::TRINITY_DN8611_c0_g3_i1::g.168598::m.168598